jgi:hypothetical protein
LGRPLGVPGDRAFQTKILTRALSLIENKGPGPVYEVFDEESTSPSQNENTHWSCPVSFAPQPARPTDFRAALVEEMQLLGPWYERGLQDRGYTSTGTSGLDNEGISSFLCAFISDQPPQESPVLDQSLSDTLKLAVEDLKAFYYESAAAQPGQASSHELARWLWDETTAGKLIRDISKASQSHTDDMVKIVGKFMLVPVNENA